MRYLKRYESLEYIHRTCQEYGISNYTINSDGSIDVDGYVSLCGKELTKLPLKFGNVSDSFHCNNDELMSLEGCPKSVGGHFDCDNNKLTSLKGCPKSVGNIFTCEYNSIETFEDLDFINIGCDFYCRGNPIHFIWILFRDHTKFEFFNDCDIIRENRVIILDRLNFFLDYIDKPMVTEVKGYKCI